ncbi:MAG: hypothetical protein K2N15_05945 [Lachnospiraceae bacterium]|nr:hypothetical protein [Lachnospiraceae bacterium]
MSGIPGMGQRWQSALKNRVVMIPLPENTAAGAASGVCCSGKGCCRVSGSHAGRSLHIPSHTGGEKIINPWQGIMPGCGVWGLLFCGRGISDTEKKITFLGERQDTYIFCDTGLQGYQASWQGNTR